jgi:hypothetical protein
MKATIDLPDELYRRVKAKSALQGRPIRDVALQLFGEWLEEQPRSLVQRASPRRPQKAPPWFGSLRKYAGNPKGKIDMAAIRRSIARGRRAEWAERDRRS